MIVPTTCIPVPTAMTINPHHAFALIEQRASEFAILTPFRAGEFCRLLGRKYDPACGDGGTKCSQNKAKQNKSRRSAFPRKAKQGRLPNFTG